jgi:threonine/homoserine/homoserine lactone efflux protein
MTILIHVLLGVILSFIGSIPFGTINVTVIETAILKGMRVAVWVVLGAAIIEFIQACVALLFSHLITQNPLTEQILFWISIPIFIGLGVYYLRQKPEESEPDALQGYAGGRGFLKGILVSSLNVLAIPYWIFYGTYLASIGWINPGERLLVVAFSIGVFLGTVFILLCYARLGVYAKARFSRLTRFISPAVAYFFFVLAGIQIVRVVLQMT